MSTDSVLIDVTRLIWRAWRGRRATGIDRVCQAYVEQYRRRGLAVIQRGGFHGVLSRRHSAALLDLMLADSGPSRPAIIGALAAALPATRYFAPQKGMIYLNLGHTGLNEDSLPRWIERNHLKAVYLIHDLIPITHPAFCRSGEVEKHRRRVSNALASAAAIICNSQVTCSELAAFAKSNSIPMPPSTVAWLGSFHPATNVRPHALERPYFVTVGTIEARKNHIVLLKAWSSLFQKLGQKTPTLVIIGGRGWEADHVFRALDHLGDLSEFVYEIGDCDDEDLARWVAGAEALLMPSWAEGFGLPIVEALQLGTPVVASDLPVFREIVGELPTYLDPADHVAWTELLLSISSEHSAATSRTHLVSRYEAPSWEDHFDKVEQLLSNL